MMFLPAALLGLVAGLLLAPFGRGRSSRRSARRATRAASGMPSADTWAGRRRRMRRRLRRTSHVVLPSALAAWADDLARALRHGSTLHAALTHTIPTDAVIEQRSASLRHWLDRGATVAEACDEWAVDLSPGHTPSRRTVSRDRVELLATMSAVLAAAASLGGAAAAPLDRLAVTMRQRASDDLERSAQSAQAKMSAKVLTSVPLAVLALLLLTDADVRAVTTSASGGTAVALGLALNAGGAAWMKRIAGSGTGTR